MFGSIVCAFVVVVVVILFVVVVRIIGEITRFKFLHRAALIVA